MDNADPRPSDVCYTGNPANQKPDGWRNLPSANIEELTHPSHYLAPPELADAVNVAVELGMPLLLTGDPGCGKSRLADSVAWELGFEGGRALRYVVHSDTTRRDLFYEFDAVGRFRAARDTGEIKHEARHFIKYNALGLAILRANGRREKYRNIMRDRDFDRLPAEGVRSVVLIDEIDKAPREVPNDLLTQLEDLRFSVPELLHDEDIALGEGQRDKRPVIVITSNAERDLPPAFLRRCVYFHMELPPFRDEAKTARVTIERIVAERLGARYKDRDDLLRDALALFRHLRNSSLEQKPSLAELLAWLLYLGKETTPAGGSLLEHPKLEASLGILLKPHDGTERSRARQMFEEWRESKR
jgi:MoxR-like ATPase